MASVLADTPAKGCEFLSCFARNSTRHRWREGVILRSMNSASTSLRESHAREETGLVGALAAFALRAAATLLLAVLVLLEPIVQPVLCAIALLTLGTAVFFRLLVGDTGFPFLGMLALSLCCMLLLALYYRVVRLLCCCD
jgi:hypothetical protein